MVSESEQIPYKSIPGPYPESCRVNQLWSDIISPVRSQFIKDRIFEREEKAFPICGRLYYPFEAEKVEYSGFWMQPHNLYFGAEIYLEAPREGKYPFILATCGGIRTYVNGRLQDEFYSYLRNQEARKQIFLPLKEGANVIRLLANDLAERDTQFYFKLQYTGEEILQGYLPCEADLEALQRKRTVLEKMYLNKFNFQDRNIDIYFEQPVKEAFMVQAELVFTDAHTAADSRKKSVWINPGDTLLHIGDLIYKEVGMVSVTLKTQAGSVELERTLNFEYYNEAVMPSKGIDTIERRKSKALKFIARYGLDDFQKALALLETGGDENLAEKILEEEIYRLNERYDCSDFRMPALIYAYRSRVFTNAQKQKIKAAILNFRYWFDEDGNDVMWFFSENHALNFHVSELLAGELFPDEIFTNSKMTGREHQEKAGCLLREWMNNFFAHGFNEWNSSVYIPIDMIGFFALYDMTGDQEMKKLAQMALDQTFGILAANSFRGIVAASYGRIYFKNLIGRRTSESTALNFIAKGQGYLNQHCFSTTLFALSSYEPPEDILKLYYAPAEGKATRLTEGEERVSLYSFKTPDYIMGSAYDYHPGACGTQEHMLQIMLKDCDTQIWINHPGEAAYFGEGRPSYFAGNGTLPLVEQERNFARVSFRLLDQEVKYTHAFCPLSRFDEWRAEEKWIFLKKEDICVAIYAENSICITREGALKNYELVSPGKENVWKVLVEYESVFGSFENFTAEVPQKY